MTDFSALDPHARRLGETSLAELVGRDRERDASLVVEGAGLMLDARKQRLDASAWSALLDLASGSDLAERRSALFSGGIVNETERRPALHPGLRNPDRLTDGDLAGRIRAAREATSRFAMRAGERDVLAGHPVRRVVNIGIGGSDLGPRFVYDALKADRRAGMEARFVSNLDPADLDDALEGADPQTTLFCVVSKSFTTQETLMNAQAARAWLVEQVGEEGANIRFCAATAAPDKARAFGIDPAQIFPFEDGVGGRYSVWSAAGLALEIALGPEAFEAFLAGARAMDDHFYDAPTESNLPVVKALIDVWNRAGLKRLSRCVAAYSSRLERLPAYLQQLEMESLGKSVTREGRPLEADRGGQLVWGGRGSDVQHSFFQWLHQGVDDAPVDFIALKSLAQSEDPRAQALTANLLAQGAALMQGQDGTGELAAHKAMAGGRVSSTLLLDALTPQTLGALIALHEHKVFVEATLYRLNPYDQWGVELGKQLARDIAIGDVSVLDPATRDLIDRLGLSPRRD